MNHTSHDVPYSHVIEHNYFEMSIHEIYEFPKAVVSGKLLADRYHQIAILEQIILFGGRLAEYK